MGDDERHQTPGRCENSMQSSSAYSKVTAKTLFQRVMNVAEMLSRHDAQVVRTTLRKSAENTDLENQCIVSKSG